MSGTALALDSAPQAPAAQQKPPKRRRIPRKIGEVVHLLVTGECKTVKAAAERVSMHPNYVYGALKEPEIRAHIEQQTRISLAVAQAPAAAVLIDLLLHANSEHVRKDIGFGLLALQGHKPRAEAQVSVNVEIKAGYVLDLREPEMKTIDAQVTHSGAK